MTNSAATRSAILTSTALALVFYASEAASQTTPPAASAAVVPAASPTAQTQEIIVTGSRIRGIKPVGSSVIALSDTQIQKEGLSSTADVLRDVPEVTNLGADESRTSANSAQRGIANITGGAGINLRGIGDEATLTLFDGNRLPPGGGEGRFFDPSSIPLIAIQRVEVVADGASAIYGSDAVAGVVNLIPVTRFDGAEAWVRYGGADGLNQFVADGKVGTSWDGGHLVLAYEYNHRSDLLAADRPNQYVNSPIYGATSANTFPANLANNAGPPPFAFLPPGTHQFTDATNSGVLNAANLTATSTAGAGVAGNWVGADALPDQTRNSGYFYGEQQLTNKLKFFVQGFVTDREIDRLLTSATTTGLTIPGLASGPYQNAYSQIAPSVGGSYNFHTMLGNEEQTGYERAWQVRTGLQADLPGNWRSTLQVSYGQTEDYSRTSNEVNPQALGAAASCQNPNRTAGPFAPPTTNVQTCNNAATAFDLFSNLQPGTAGFGYPSSGVYQSLVSSINGYAYNHPTVPLTDVNLKADGPLFDLPAGKVRVAVGAEYQNLQRNNVTGGTIYGPSTSAEVDTTYPNFNRDVESVFGELYIPLIGANNNVPLVKSLSLSVAGRYDHYNDTSPAIASAGVAAIDNAFDTVNPKVGVTWAPVDDLQIHGSYGTSFRAPVPGDYALGAPTLGIPFTVTPAVATALGISQNCATQANSCYLVELQGGQPNVKPETATTYSIGADYKPSWFHGFSATLNYYNIDYTNQIVVPGTGPFQSSPGYALALQNAGLLVANPTLGSFGTFSPTVRGYLSYGNGNAVNPSQEYTKYAGLPGYLFGQGILPTTLLIDSRSTNSGTLQTDGIDYTLRYSWTNPWGDWTVGDVGTYVFNYRQSLAQGAPLVQYVNTINNPVRFQTRADIGWSNRAYTANVFLNYVNSYSNPGIGSIASFTTIDVSLSADLAAMGLPTIGKTIIGLDVQNLFDQSPPSTVNIANQLAYDPQEASVIGRFISVQVRERF